MALVFYILGVVVALVAYLWHCDRAIRITHPEAAKLVNKPWTLQQVKEAYRRAETDPIDVRKFLPPKLGRRYVVTGGSGEFGCLGECITARTPSHCFSWQASLAAG